MIFARQLGLLSLACALGSCALAQPGIHELQVPPVRIIQKGYSLLPRNEAGWRILRRGPKNLALMRRGDKPDETFAIEAAVLELPRFTSNEELIRLVKDAESANSDPSRFEMHVHEVGPASDTDTSCIRSHMVAIDRAAKTPSGNIRFMMLEKLTMVCVHPKNNSIGISIAYSRRNYPGQRDSLFHARASSVLNRIEFNEP